MKPGETVLVRANNGELVEAEVIETHGDIVRLMGPGERAIIRDTGRLPLGVGYKISAVEKSNAAKT